MSGYGPHPDVHDGLGACKAARVKGLSIERHLSVSSGRRQRSLQLRFTVPYLIDKLVPQMAAAVDGDPATKVVRAA
jgi:hypothetical protein